MRDVGGRKRVAFVSQLLAWGRANRRSFPWREDSDPFRILIAEVLLQRSRGNTVAKVYWELFARWEDAAALSAAYVPAIAEVIRPLGLLRRAAVLKALARKVVDRGGVPSSTAELMELPGVGRYAAAATAAAAFRTSDPSVDSVSARVYRRYFGTPANSDPASDQALWKLVLDTSQGTPVWELNWAALDLAAAICLPKIPRCPLCPLQRDCSLARSMSYPAPTLLQADES
jgi:A/G-specific adenine glycosylase